MLHGLIEDASNDIVVRLDSRGFIIHASANAIELGIDPATLLVMPHIADLADPDHADDLTRHVAQVLADGDRSGWRSGWTEFPLCPLREPGVESEDAGDAARRRRWYALSLRAIAPDDNVPQGALGLLRSVDHGYALGSELGARAAIDLQTGLANRRSFCAALARVIDSAGVTPHVMAVFAVDRIRAIFMRYGQETADEIRWGFARFLETMTAADQELALLDEERFAVLLPGMELRGARAWAGDVLQTFAGLTASARSLAPELTASVGLARVEIGVDWTLRQAELGLVLARAGGGMQVGVGRSCANLANGALLHEAMEAAVKGALQRAAARGNPPANPASDQ